MDTFWWVYLNYFVVGWTAHQGLYVVQWIGSRNYRMQKVNVKNISIVSRRIMWNCFSLSIHGFAISSSTFVFSLRRKDTPVHMSIPFRSMPLTWPKQCTKRFSTLVRIHDWVSMTNSRNSLPAPSPNGSPVSYLDEEWERSRFILLLQELKRPLPLINNGRFELMQAS